VERNSGSIWAKIAYAELLQAVEKKEDLQTGRIAREVEKLGSFLELGRESHHCGPVHRLALGSARRATGGARVLGGNGAAGLGHDFVLIPSAYTKILKVGFTISQSDGLLSPYGRSGSRRGRNRQWRESRHMRRVRLPNISDGIDITSQPASARTAASRSDTPRKLAAPTWPSAPPKMKTNNTGRIARNAPSHLLIFGRQDETDQCTTE
jgi:hypothetical protein